MAVDFDLHTDRRTPSRARKCLAVLQARRICVCIVMEYRTGRYDGERRASFFQRLKFYGFAAGKARHAGFRDRPR